jgi:hypothetical protein
MQPCYDRATTAQGVLGSPGPPLNMLIFDKADS